MPSRAMIVVGGGASTRFGGDKLMTEVGGKPLLSHTLEAVAQVVDVCVLVCRAEIAAAVSRIHPETIVARGGQTRTASEMAGLAALGGEADLIGIHDAARPAVSPSMVQRLFELAAEHGGAIPALTPERLVIDRRTHQPVKDVVMAQTPQVFRGPELLAAYVRAAEAGFEGHDTAEVVHRFGDLEIVALAGDSANVKVTYPRDVEAISALLGGPSRT